MFTFLLVVQALIAAALVGVVLMQQSEGGGLGMGGSPSGLMSARGAADFLTRSTAVLAVIFVSLSIALAVLATQRTAPTTIDTSLARTPLPAAPVTQPAVPLSGSLSGGAVPATGGTVPSAPVNAAPAPVVPMAAPTPTAKPKPAAVRPPATASGDTKPATPAIKVVPTRTLPKPIVSNMPTPAPTADEANRN